MAPDISIVIPTRNRTEILLTSIEKLMDAIRGVRAEIIIVNDGDGNLASRFSAFDIVLVENEGSGVAAARNTGAKHSTAEIILFMDDDMWLTHEALDRVLHTHVSEDSIALNVNWIYPSHLSGSLVDSNFGRYLLHYGFTTLKGWFGDTKVWRDGEAFVTTGITSQNLSMRRSTFTSTGGYNEAFPMAGFEDHDFSRRLNTQAIKIVVDPTVMMFHNESDRVVLGDWLDRKVRGGITRRVAVDLGYNELELRYGWLKYQVLTLVGLIKPVITRLLSMRLLNRASSMDRLSFSLINLLLAESIFRGYLSVGSQKKDVTIRNATQS